MNPLIEKISSELHNRPEFEFVKDIFGLRAPEHPYLRCEECGAEYYKIRPLYCSKCGYAGGAIVAPPLWKLPAIMRKYLGDDYESAMDTYKAVIMDELAKTTKRKLRQCVMKYESDFRDAPRSLGLLLCAFYELTKD